MVWRRISLLLVGIAGGALTAAILYVSVIETLNRQVSACFNGDCFLSNVGVKNQTAEITEENTYPFGLIQGTSLLLERLAVYEGPFLEDGTNREVTNVAALMVRNLGQDEIVNCGVTLCFGDACFDFYGERIPAGMAVLLIESSGAQYRSDPFVSCTGWQVIANEDRKVSELIAVEERAMGILAVTNLSDKTLSDIHIFYKNWLFPPDILVGGIAYSVLIPKLLPGETEVLFPYHFVYGYSKVVSITSE